MGRLDGKVALITGGARGMGKSRLVAYLASDESSYSTGSEFVADGGLLCGPGY